MVGMPTIDANNMVHATDGKFAGTVNTTADPLASGDPVQFVRTASGVHRVRALTPEVAAHLHEQATGEKAEPVVFFDYIARATAGRISVEYAFEGEGEDGDYNSQDENDTPFARVSITVNPEEGDEVGEPETFSFCTRVPAYSDSDLVTMRAISISSALGSAYLHGEDPLEVAQRYAEQLNGRNDPSINPPATADEAVDMFRDRDGNRVIGWYVVNDYTDDRTGPYVTEDIAELHVPRGVGHFRVQVGPVFLPNGNLVTVEPTAPDGAVGPSTREPGCACATNSDGSRTPTMCRIHADQDPCLTVAQITGKRRKGTIKNGVCTNCGWSASAA